MQTDNLELKKLVYLYLMNYAKSQPDLAILAVNTFAKDCHDPNPLIRALAVRTMGCIRVDKITEYLCEPLRKCLRDDDPYVRKTACVCVAKLYDINSTLVEDQGFLELLKETLSDSNPMVVANAVAALAEIGETSQTATTLSDLDTPTINKLLTALNECTEWGQIFILDSIAVYTPTDDREAQSVCERVTPRLSHANAAVVLSAVKVLMRMAEAIPEDSPFLESLGKKLAPPLVTLLSSQPEIQYVALRNINLIVQKRPGILKDDMKVFFVKYNDPIYVKLEKLDIMIRLTNEHNIAQVLSELKEYATEVDVDFVRRSVRAIGRCAIKVSEQAERCVSTLLDLIQTKVNYVVQEAIVVIRDIFRKYPNKYENIISILCENLDSLDEPEARASMIWILGEYAERIDNASDLLGAFLENFHDETTTVQLQLLTAVVKLFLKCPTNTQELVQSVLGMATQDSDNPDLRDRGYIYWRLLSTDPTAAKEVVLADKPLISEETDKLEPNLLDELIGQLSTLASVYHKPPNSFIEGKAPVRRITLPVKPQPSAVEYTEEEAPIGTMPTDDAPVPASQNLEGGDLIGDLLSLEQPTVPSGGGYNVPSGGGGEVDLLGGDLSSLFVSGQPQGPIQTGGLEGLADLFGPSVTGPASYSPPKEVWLSAVNGQGLEIMGSWSRRSGSMYMDMTFTNKAMSSMGDFAIQFNKNSFGLLPGAALQVWTPLMPNQSNDTSLIVNGGGAVLRMDPLTSIQVAVKNNVKVFYFTCTVPMHALLAEDGKLDRKVFLASWKEIPNTNEVRCNINNLTITPEQVEKKMEANNIFLIAKRSVDVGSQTQNLLYMSMRFINSIWVLVELKITPGNPVAQVGLLFLCKHVLKAWP
jgi:AP-1 complex subunit beta-1